MSQRAKKGVICILKLLWSIGEKSPSIFFKLFDAPIQPMLSYGAEVGGGGLLQTPHPIERIHLFALKRFLNTRLRTPNVMIYGETGRYPLFVNIYVKCIKFWLRILKMPPHRLPFRAYRMLLDPHEQNKKTWASSVYYVFAQVWLWWCPGK